MKHIIENDRLKIEISDTGAELSSIYDKKNDREVLWQADPAYWKRHAPILFPNVGKTWQNRYLYNGSTYPTKQHGFARDMTFECICSDNFSITHRLCSDASTLNVYPFPFILEITQTLSKNHIQIQWRVTNTGTETMYYTIGAHPAFNVPAEEGTEQKDYQLLFHTDNPAYILLDPQHGTACPDTSYILETKDGRLSIGESRFAKDALIFDHQITWAGIAFPDGTPYVSVTCGDFPYFGIWSAKNAPFVCLEPWDGRCDNCGFDGDISTKPGIISLDPGCTYNKSYTITIH